MGPFGQHHHMDADATAGAIRVTLVADGDVVWRFLFSPDGRRVVYRADQDTDEVFELYVTDEGQTEPYVVYLPLALRD